MEFDNLITLIKEVSSSELTDFSLKDGDWEISMEKKEKELVVTSPDRNMENVMSAVITGEKKPEKGPEELSGQQVKAPLVGTYYSASSPDTEDFVKVGDTVKKGQTLGIIEAMKLMNEIESEYDGVVEEILVENGQMVEYGQVLFVIK